MGRVASGRTCSVKPLLNQICFVKNEISIPDQLRTGLTTSAAADVASRVPVETVLVFAEDIGGGGGFGSRAREENVDKGC